MKKSLIFALVIIIVLSVTIVGSGAEPVPVATTIGWVSNNPYQTLYGFDELVEDGLNRVEFEFDDIFEINRYYPGDLVLLAEPDFEFDYSENVRKAAFVNDIVLVAGFYFDQAIQEVAPDYPETMFITIDFVSLDHSGCTVGNHYDPETCVYFDNVVSYTFNEEEGSFLVGLVAGSNTKTDIVGFIGGMDFDLINRFECGYRAGVKTANVNNDVIVDYAYSFADKFQGFYYATNQHEIDGADVIYHAAGGTGMGVIESAGLFDYWAIGVDVDQSHLSPANVLCSMTKRVDQAVYTAIDSLTLPLEFPLGENEIRLGIADEGVGYSDLAGNLSKKTIKLLNYYIDNPIGVPGNYEDLEEFIENLEN